MEKPNTSGSNSFIIGLFVTLGFMVSSVFVVFMGGGSLFSGDITVSTVFEDVSGLNVGAPVYKSGLQIGRVSSKNFEKNSTGVIVELSIYNNATKKVSENAQAEIVTQGMLGDKAVMLHTSEDFGSPVSDGAVLVALEAKGIGDYLEKGGDIVETVNELSKNLNLIVKDLHRSGRLPKIMKNLDELTNGLNKSFGEKNGDFVAAMASLKNVLKKIDQGQGTMGKLVNDSSLHEDMKILLGGAQRSKLVRFMLRQAIAAEEGQNIEAKED